MRPDQGPRGTFDRSDMVLLAVIIGLIALFMILGVVFAARSELIENRLSNAID